MSRAGQSGEIETTPLNRVGLRSEGMVEGVGGTCTPSMEGEPVCVAPEAFSDGSLDFGCIRLDDYAFAVNDDHGVVGMIDGQKARAFVTI